jgi:hypothetical protein
LSGTTGTPQSARVAQISQHIRNVETFGKLQGAVISSVTDMPTMFAAAHMNKLPMLDLIANIPRAFASNTPVAERGSHRCESPATGAGRRPFGQAWNRAFSSERLRGSRFPNSNSSPLPET